MDDVDKHAVWRPRRQQSSGIGSIGGGPKNGRNPGHDTHDFHVGFLFRVGVSAEHVARRVDVVDAPAHCADDTERLRTVIEKQHAKRRWQGFKRACWHKARESSVEADAIRCRPQDQRPLKVDSRLTEVMSAPRGIGSGHSGQHRGQVSG